MGRITAEIAPERITPLSIQYKTTQHMQQWQDCALQGLLKKGRCDTQTLKHNACAESFSSKQRHTRPQG
jgi:hypothetical protein